MLNNESNEYIFESSYSPTKCFKYFSQDEMTNFEHSHALDEDSIEVKSQKKESDCPVKDLNVAGIESPILETASGIDFEQIDLMVNFNQIKVKEMYFKSQFEEIIKYLNLSYPDVRNEIFLILSFCSVIKKLCISL